MNKKFVISQIKDLRLINRMFVMITLSVILIASIGSVTAEEEMSTYRNKEYGFSIDYPEDWTMIECYMGNIMGDVAFFLGHGVYAIVGVEDLPREMTPDEYITSAIKELRSGVSSVTCLETGITCVYPMNVVETFNDTINGEPVAGSIYTIGFRGAESKQMLAAFVNDKTAYLITFTAPLDIYDKAEVEYFEPMLHSFRFS